MKNLILILSLGILGGGSYWAWTHWQMQDSPALHDQALSTAPVERRNIFFNVSAAGEIGPAEQVSVRPEINGKIDSLLVDIGDRVKKGDTLFTLDDQELRNQRDARKVEVERTELQLEQAERNYTRSQRLYEESLISLEENENFRTAYELAQNSRDRAQKELDVLEEGLRKTKILAPFDCTVLDRPVSVGQAVSGSGGVGGGTEVLVIADLNKMMIQAHINQADITRLKVDQQVEVVIEALPGIRLTGVVERLAPQASIKNNIKGYLARIMLQNVDSDVLPGMTANIKIPVDSAEDVLAIPLAAVFTEHDKETGRSQRYVFVPAGDGYERRPVQVGLADYFHAEIQSGLKETDQVCLEQPPADRVIVIENTAGSKESPQGSNAAQHAKPAAGKDHS